MNDTSRRPMYVASAAVAMAIVAFMLGSAPFTPALVLAVLVIPIACTCIVLGAWRTSAVALYWAVAALIAAPASRAFHFRIDFVLLALGVIGLVLSAILYAAYARTR